MEEKKEALESVLSSKYSSIRTKFLEMLRIKMNRILANPQKYPTGATHSSCYRCGPISTTRPSVRQAKPVQGLAGHRGGRTAGRALVRGITFQLVQLVRWVRVGSGPASGQCRDGAGAAPSPERTRVVFSRSCRSW